MNAAIKAHGLFGNCKIFECKNVDGFRNAQKISSSQPRKLAGPSMADKSSESVGRRAYPSRSQRSLVVTDA